MDRIELIEKREQLIEKSNQAITEKEHIEISEDIAGIDEQLAELDFFDPKLIQEELRELHELEKPDLEYCDYSELED
ncbi:hypothetical protein Metho_2478 (plasmid) [Methanomethylovorans hollandica DSM 15978]|jgi:Leucine-rich repeat (LRR) protein|uniref:Uncharacterized protein n=1 Tax=Methanomethylovorans hollandica (strain DSM 15978 / NBRC 107637 / DMS1) TaxID=867904 RepID=L0L2G8_METHD|nr:hypothetical protein [Methanomethylovorans hollandica]AGB50618.1 hypothetical protein Metho_2478 [Methanomethylovorans hollandica DSM 15978]